jgi:methylphosphotriester-DNA--protein-cysteine methyltransferase
MAAMAGTCIPLRKSSYVGQMLALIEARSAERLSGDVLSKVIGRRPAYLGRLFRQQLGMSVRAYVALTRMERAARAIRDGEKVEAVALEVGYRSKKNFYRQFKRRFGTTPAKYRATHT